MDTVIGIAIIAAVIIAAIWWTKRSNDKRKAEVWTGTVEKKWVSSYTDEDGDTTRTPMIKVLKDDGKKKKYSVSTETYEALNEGDKIKKEAGQIDPFKV